MESGLIVMAHGGGGERTRRLVETMCAEGLDNPILRRMDDAAQLTVAGRELVFTTDAFVVDPPFFPGGDIGRLAVCGTVNDLAVQGGRPRYLSAAFVFEEGFPVADARQIAASMGVAAAESGVLVVAGDTKVVERGKGGGVYIVTSGIGERLADVDVGVGNARAGDAVMVSGPVGDHGLAVMGCREGLALSSPLVSDVAPVWGLVEAILGAGRGIRCLRDPTRGGLAAALCDIASASGVGIVLDEAQIPVRREVVAACELLGLDPLVAACEGRVVAVCDPGVAEGALAAWRGRPEGEGARIIGAVAAGPRGVVTLATREGGQRVVDMPAGDVLPRIC